MILPLLVPSSSPSSTESLLLPSSSSSSPLVPSSSQSASTSSLACKKVPSSLPLPPPLPSQAGSSWVGSLALEDPSAHPQHAIAASALQLPATLGVEYPMSQPPASETQTLPRPPNLRQNLGSYLPCLRRGPSFHQAPSSSALVSRLWTPILRLGSSSICIISISWPSGGLSS